jgi:iron complex outermembrane receptor protein
LSADDRLEVRFVVGQSKYDQHITQTAVRSTGLLSNALDEQRFTDRSTSLNGKWTRVLNNGHQWVSGVEHEGVRRVEEASAGAGDESGNLKARTARWAAYTQDEFKINPNWSAYARGRWVKNSEATRAKFGPPCFMPCGSPIRPNVIKCA